MSCRNQYVVVGCVCCVVSGAAPVCGVVLWFVLVVDGGGGPPGSVPIPVAKPIHADGTAPGGVWESRLPPTRIFQYWGVGCTEPGRCGLRLVHSTPLFCMPGLIPRVTTWPSSFDRSASGSTGQREGRFSVLVAVGRRRSASLLWPLQS